MPRSRITVQKDFKIENKSNLSTSFRQIDDNAFVLSLGIHCYSFKKNTDSERMVVLQNPLFMIVQNLIFVKNTILLTFFRKLLVEDGGGAVGEEETDPVDRGQQVFWKTIWNFQKYLQIFITLEICPVWCTISTVSKTKLWKLFGIAETTQI